MGKGGGGASFALRIGTFWTTTTWSMASIRASWTLGFSSSPCYRIKVSNAFRNKQNTPRNFNQPNVVIAFEKNCNPSLKPYMGIAKKKN
jgi:hypothetical protein